jgi:hypothetical protein
MGTMKYTILLIALGFFVIFAYKEYREKQVIQQKAGCDHINNLIDTYQVIFDDLKKDLDKPEEIEYYNRCKAAIEATERPESKLIFLVQCTTKIRGLERFSTDIGTD